jgi:hypothetical protein
MVLLLFLAALWSDTPPCCACCACRVQHVNLLLVTLAYAITAPQSLQVRRRRRLPPRPLSLPPSATAAAACRRGRYRCRPPPSS